MNINNQERAFKNAMNELKQLLGAVMVLEIFVNNAKSQIDNDNKIGHDLIVGSLSFRNITLDKGEPNLYLMDSYLLGRSNLDEEVDMILSRESLFQISQAYETLETFLYDLVADLIFNKGGLNIFVNNNSDVTSFETIRSNLKSFNDRQNNRHLIRLIRTNCQIFKEYEKSNVYDFDFEQWYLTLGEVRHCITHNRMVVNPNLKSKVTNYLNGDMQTKTYLNKEYLYLTPTMCRGILSRIADFVFFCYKSVSETTYSAEVNFATIDWLTQGLYKE